MISLPLPAYSARPIFEICADSIQDAELSRRLYSVMDYIEAAETHYKEQGVTASLFSIVETTTIAGRVTVEEMKSLYNDTFVKSRYSRPIYNALKAAPKNGICPLCGQRVVSTLDHYLAKSRHPALAVTPVNLVPCCADCNKVKLAVQPNRASDQTLHPYFDNVDDEVWLVADLKESTPPAFVFSAAPPFAWDDLKRERVLTHFRIFGLGNLYAAHAAVELQNIEHNLVLIADRGGANTLRAHLSEQAESRHAAAKNSWQSAMYKALAKSDWFCLDGYKTISALGEAA